MGISFRHSAGFGKRMEYNLVGEERVSMGFQEVPMSDVSYDIFSGRKTFFIAPDISLLPETYMEEYLSHGYETYIICDDRYCSLKKKVELIINLFRDSILFFYTLLGYQKWCG